MRTESTVWHWGSGIIPNGSMGRQFDGQILDWLTGANPTILMTRYYVPEVTTRSHTAETAEGYGVDLIDTRTLKATPVERPTKNVRYFSDGRGVVRFMTQDIVRHDELLTGRLRYFYRALGERDWRQIPDEAATGDAMIPLAVDSGVNAVYILKSLAGRKALYRMSLDGSLKTELGFAHAEVDVQNVVFIGRSGRVISAYYETDKPHIEYCDLAYQRLTALLARAIPGTPMISFVSASADEQILVIFASSNKDPGRYFVMDRRANRLSELMSVRPQLLESNQIRGVLLLLVLRNS